MNSVCNDYTTIHIVWLQFSVVKFFVFTQELPQHFKQKILTPKNLDYLWEIIKINYALLKLFWHIPTCFTAKHSILAHLVSGL